MAKRAESKPWSGKHAVCPVTKQQHPDWMLYCARCGKGKS